MITKKVKPALSVITHINIFVARLHHYFSRFRIYGCRMVARGGVSHIHGLIPLLLLLCFGIARATTIITIYTVDAIFIGADSLRQITNGGVNGSITVCKINRTGGIFFAIDGLSSNGSLAVPELSTITSAALGSAGSSMSKVSAALAAIKAWLQIDIEWSRVNDPANFQAWVRQEQYPTGIACPRF